MIGLFAIVVMKILIIVYFYLIKFTAVMELYSYKHIFLFESIHVFSLCNNI